MRKQLAEDCVDVNVAIIEILSATDIFSRDRHRSTYDLKRDYE